MANGLLGQFMEDHPWWEEYAKDEDERRRKEAFIEELKRREERRSRLREEAMERIGWTGDPHC